MQSKLRVEVSRNRKKDPISRRFSIKGQATSCKKNWVQWAQPHPCLFLKSDRDCWRISKWFVTFFVQYHH